MISFFLFSTFGRVLIGAAAGILLLFGVYGKGYFDGRAAYKAKIERQIADAVKKGDVAREKALRDFDALPDNGLPNDGFRRD